VGPTASGKSALAMDLAQKYYGEIICADSRTVYKGFDIGTAKPSLEDQKLVPHHLLDVSEPGEEFSAARFKELADEAMRDIWARGKVAFLVGGSGMYVDAVLFDYGFRSDTPGSVDDNPELSLDELQSLVRSQYPEQYKVIDNKNRLRLEQIVQRGLATTDDRRELAYDCLILGLNPDRLYLKQNIEDRIDVMLNNGFIQEVEGLVEKHGYGCPQLNIIGYRHAASYLRGEIDLGEMKQRFARDDMALAKRQVTWFKRNSAIHWCDQSAEAGPLVTQYLAKN
jgi:tRNA dimethylallyltransferase